MNNIQKIFTDHRDRELIKNDEISFLDEDWLSETFMIPKNKMDDNLNIIRFSSLADGKFVDTSLGGNISINVLPQFTRYADIRRKGLIKDRNDVTIGNDKGNYGMGRYYSEAIDDNSTNVYFEFGVGKFQSILFYLLSAVDYKKSVIANSARTPFFYNAGFVFGTGALILAFPLITIPFLIAKKAVTMAMDLGGLSSRFKQYYLEPTMFLYWSTVNSLVEMMATELGLLSYSLEENKSDRVGASLRVSQEDLDALRKLMPNLLTTKNGLNVMAMVSITQKRYIDYKKKLDKARSKAKNLDELAGEIKDLDTTVPGNIWEEGNEVYDSITKDPRHKGLDPNKEDKASELLKTAGSEVDKKKHKTVFSPDDDGTYKKGLREEEEDSWITSVFKTSKAVASEGARYATFRVGHVGSVSESFSNSTSNVEATDTINNMGQKFRDIKMMVGNDGAVGTLMNSVVDFAAGSLSGVTAGFSDVVASFLSGAKIDVPKRWTESNINLPTLSFKMELVSPSAHPIAQLRNIYIPLASILAGVLPLSTGPASSTSPFLCSMFVRGLQKVSLGMITNVSITRGTSNLPYNRQRRPLAVEVSFTVTDFSQVMSAPIVADLLDTSNVMYDDESGISRYIQSLCSRDLYSSTHFMDKVRIKLSRFIQDAQVQVSSDYWGVKIGDTIQSLPLVNMFTGSKAVNTAETQ